MFHLMSPGRDGLNAHRFAHHFWLHLTENQPSEQHKSGLRIREVPVNPRRNVYDFSDKISQPLVFYLPRQSHPGTMNHPVIHWTISLSPKGPWWNFISRSGLNYSRDESHACDACVSHTRLAHGQDQETPGQWCHDRLTPWWQVCRGFSPVCPRANVKYVNVVHVGFIWSSIIILRVPRSAPPPWETRAEQETLCFRKQQTSMNYRQFRHTWPPFWRSHTSWCFTWAASVKFVDVKSVQ